MGGSLRSIFGTLLLKRCHSSFIQLYAMVNVMVCEMDFYLALVLHCFVSLFELVNVVE